MKILVCITNVPDTTAKISFSDDKKKFNDAGVQFIIGPYDEYALSKAVDIKEKNNATIVVLNVGGPETEPTIRKALAIGADEAIRVNATPTDAWFVAKQIAAVAIQFNPAIRVGDNGANQIIDRHRLIQVTVRSPEQTVQPISVIRHG